MLPSVPIMLSRIFFILDLFLDSSVSTFFTLFFYGSLRGPGAEISHKKKEKKSKDDRKETETETENGGRTEP